MNNNVLIIVNYLIRGIFIVVGILIISGLVFPKAFDKTTLNIIGGLFIFWGIYRIIIFRLKMKKYQTHEEDEDERDLI
jgi:hypothetical protein